MQQNKRVRFVLTLALASLASCGPEPVECSRFEGAATLRCMDEMESKGERAMLLKCLPFSEPEEISGVWVTGFERNAFFEGRRATDEYILTGYSDTELITAEGGRATENYEALEVELTGRRSLCPFTKITPHLIVADKMKVKSARRLVAR